MSFLHDSFIFNRLRHKFRRFILKESNPPPLLFFLVFTYFHYPFETAPPSFGPLLFMFAVVVALACNFSFLFTMAPFLQVPATAAVPMLAICLLSCNEKWKVYLLIFAIGDAAFSSSAQQYFLAIFSLVICFQIHRTLVFRTLSDNIQFFIGMAAVCASYTLSIVSANFNLAIKSQMFVILVIVTASLAHAYIRHRLQRLRQANPDRIYSDRIMAHYLKMMEEETIDPLLLRTRILFHSRKCHRECCFCHSQEHSDKTEYLMRQLYENALQRFRDASDSLLYENYVEFLLLNQQAINALHFLCQWQPKGYHSYIARERARARVEMVLREANSSNLYQLQYEYALQYDRHYQRVAQEINRLLKLKLQFWGEVGRENPRVARMQGLGSEIIDRMYELNLFYNRIIKGYERSLFLFDTTALYAMYMLSTTNFKEYAELIIKNTAKLLEQVYVFENSASETFAIRTVVKREQSCFIDHPHDNLKSIRNMSTSHTFIQIYDNTCCKLIIDAVSSGLCKVLHIKRSDLIGRELNSIIPDGYKEVHNVRLSYLLDFQSDSLKEIVPSKVMHKELKLPIKGADGQLAMGYVCIKSIVDLKEGLTFVSVVKLAHDRSSHVLMDFEGRITESEDGFNKEILGHSQIQRYLQRLRKSWSDEKVIRQEKFNIMINTANYGITISSPLLGLFLEKENLKEKAPPIHLEIVNEQTSRNRTAENDRYNKIGLQIKHMEKAICTYDAESSTNSSKGGSSAVAIISTFSEGNSAPLYRFLQLAFLATILSCVLSNLGAYFITELPWDPTSAQRNPINDTMNLYALEMLTVKALITLGDEQSYLLGGNGLNQTRISQYFGFANYEESAIAFTTQLQSAFKESIYNCLGSPSELLEPIINQRLNTSLSISNPVEFTNFFSSTGSQNVTYLDLLMIYVTDFNLMSRLKLWDTTLSYSYTVPVAGIQNCTFISPLINEAVKHKETISIAVHIALIFVIALLLIPSYLLLRRRLSLHEKVFDLLASIDAEQVASEIRSLDYICNILRNYKESNEIMKMNVLGYQENLIHPRGSRRSSADNEMVIGLEKYDTSNENYEIMVNHHSQFEPTSSHFESNASKSNPHSRHDSIINKRHDSMILGKQDSKKSLQKENPQKDTILSLIKRGFLSTQQERGWNKRKRSGELDLAGSMLDPANKLLRDHCVLYLVSLSFLLILGLSLHFQLQFNTSYLHAKDELLYTYSDQINFEAELLTSKVFFAGGSAFFSQFFGVPNALMMLVPMLNSFPVYSYNDGLNIYSEIIANCSATTALPAGFLKKYCQFDYSEVILKGEFGSIFKQLIELRYLIDSSGSGLDVTAIQQNITEKLYYLQSLNLRLEELVLQKVTLIWQSLVQLGREYKLRKTMMLVVSVLWGILCCVCGFGVVLRMKEGYFREVFMITFLTNEMIVKNKRVESFLELIAKNSST